MGQLGELGAKAQVQPDLFGWLVPVGAAVPATFPVAACHCLIVAYEWTDVQLVVVNQLLARMGKWNATSRRFAKTRSMGYV
jgi:hypothetical protein